MTKLGTRKTRQEEIQKMVNRIVERFHREKIILFGSHARGEAGPDSDVDLLVVIHIQGSKREAQLDVRRSLHNVRVPKDVVVSTPEEFAWRKAPVSGLYSWCFYAAPTVPNFGIAET